MNVAYLCLGGNIGKREVFLQEALQKISQQAGTVELTSGIYETEAWGTDNQQAYLNQCIELHTPLDAAELLQTLLSIEQSLGRQRTESSGYQSRTIDIDVLLYNDAIINTNELAVPHPRMQLRKFVLIPLNEIAPNYLHPVINKTIFSLLNECSDASEVKSYKHH